eukprot:Em0010g671a
MGRPRKNEDEQRLQRVMAKRHTKTPARFLNTLSDSDMMFLDPVPTLGSHKLSTGTGSSDLIGPAQSLEAPLLNYTKAQSVKPLDTSSPTNILCVLSQLGIVEKSAVLDVRRLPSIDDRKKARTKADITGKAFATLERVFSRIVTGVLKMLLPAWHVPDKMWKQMIHIPIENTTENIDDEAQLKDLPLEYVQEILAKVGGKSSKATMKRIMFQAKVDAEMKDEVVKLAVETVYSWNNDIKSQLITSVKAQMDMCALISGQISNTESCTVTTHSPEYTLDLVEHHAPCTDSATDVCGLLECEACRCSFLFYDQLRQSALMRFSDDSKQDVLADILLTIHQCERRTYRYMAHVVQDVQQQYLMKKARHSMSADTVYIVFDFKQKFWSRGFREGGDACYGKKGMQWFGMAAFVKNTTDAHICQQDTLGDNEVEDAEGDEVDILEGDEVGEVVEGLVEKMDHFGDEVEGLGDEIEGLVDEVENFGDDVESLGNDEVACSVADDTEGVKNVQMEGKEQEFESTNEVSYSSVNLSAVTDNECSKVDAVNDHESDTTLHFVDCIVQDDVKSDSFVALSCLEAGLHALHRRFPHLKQVILQSDNAKNFSGKDMKMFVHQAVSSTGMELLAYHHNEAAAGKDVCDTHFAHQQARVDAYISEGDGGRKVSTAKQLAVALSTKSVKNTIVLLVKPKQDAPFRSTNVAAIQGIMNFYSIEYNSEKQKVMFYRNLGQSVPSVCRKMVTAPLSSNDEDPFGNSGKNFSGSTVMLHNLGSKKLTTRVEEFIAKCWQEGESKIVNGKKVKSRLKVSAEAVQSRLVAQYEEGQLRLSEVPVIGQVRLVYQRIGQSKSSLKLPKKRRKKSSEDGIKFQKVCRSFGEIQWGSVNLNLLKLLWRWQAVGPAERNTDGFLHRTSAQGLKVTSQLILGEKIQDHRIHYLDTDKDGLILRDEFVLLADRMVQKAKMSGEGEERTRRNVLFVYIFVRTINE